MTDITLHQAEAIVTGALAHARAHDLAPLLVLVLDARGAPKACAAEDGTSHARYDIARGKANGALAMGMGSRSVATRARDMPIFVASLASVIAGGLVAGPGGVLVRDASGAVVGAVGISGDVGNNDEAAAVAGIGAAGLAADPGKD